MKKALVFALALVGLVAAGCPAPADTTPQPDPEPEVVVPEGDSTLSLVNGSSYAIYQMYLSPAAEPVWGPDQLGSDVLEAGETLTLSGISCDTYDVKVVDEDGEECILEDLSLCFDDAVWTLDDGALAVCQIFTAVEGSVVGTSVVAE